MIFFFNACVGKNGTQNLYKYAHGYRESFLLLGDALFDDDKHVTVDTIVYPMCLLARHAIELYLKDFIEKCDRILKYKNLRCVWHPAGHSISILLDDFKQGAALADRRILREIGIVEEVLNDFSEVDDTEEVFRYPNDLKNRLMLESVSHINLRILFERASHLLGFLDYLSHRLSQLCCEYRLGTFTTKLSRDDIRNISLRLPQYRFWRESLGVVKASVMKDYELSSRDFSRAIDIIKGHYEFSNNCGFDVEIDGLDLCFYLYVSRPEFVVGMLNYIDRGVESDIVKDLSLMNICSGCSFLSLMDLGRDDLYESEDYDDLFCSHYDKSCESWTKVIPEMCEWLRKPYVEYLKNGLAKVGKRWHAMIIDI